MNILDVWFDSGSSHEAVLSVRPELTWPSDMYLEGSDQHRGWFQSSLLLGLGTRGRAPYREVHHHGFLIDMDGRKMSKSIGNVIAPQDVIKQSGADILRLVGRHERLRGRAARQQGDPRARRPRRTARSATRCATSLANLYDFDPAARSRADARSSRKWTATSWRDTPRSRRRS